jgi:hypothetical protein
MSHVQIEVEQLKHTQIFEKIQTLLNLPHGIILLVNSPKMLALAT